MTVDASVIVAGAGPAGAVAARTLAAAGIDTLLVDRSAFQQVLFASRRTLAGLIGRASNGSALTAALLEYFRGERSYSALRRHILFRYPMTALRLVRSRRPDRKVAS